MNFLIKNKLRYINLKLGKKYTLFYDQNYKTECIFIKATNTGYNFLIIDKNVCFFKRLLYKRKSSTTDKLIFVVPKYLKIIEKYE